MRRIVATVTPNDRAPAQENSPLDACLVEWRLEFTLGPRFPRSPEALVHSIVHDVGLTGLVNIAIKESDT